MYASYYKLKKEPFHITPDPAFLFLSDSHKEALASIIYGVGNRKGFVLITGEVGVGKTTIIRSYLEEADRSKTKILYVFNSNVTFRGLLKTIYREMGLIELTDDIVELVNQLHYTLIEEYRKGNTVVLIIDEAQNMPVATLENMRMLSNLETSTDKLIQIVFSGQPEFERKLECKELRQLKQRIAVKATIRPLTPEESRAYIDHRLTRAKAENTALFTDSALKKIISEARGIPRIINIICANAFMTALGYRQERVTAKVIDEVIADLYGRKKKPRAKAVAISIAVILLASLAYALYTNDFKLSLPDSAHHRSPPVAGNGTIASPPTAPADTTKEVPPSRQNAEPALVAREQIPAQGPAPVVKTVRKGDTLSKLVYDVYGFSSRELLQQVKDSNDVIYDINRIQIGDRILFPARKNGRERSHE